MKPLLPDTDDVSHLVQDNGFKFAVILEARNVVDVKRHLALETYGRASSPYSSRTSETEESSNTVDGLDRSGNVEAPGWIFGVAPARHVGDDLGPSVQTVSRVGFSL